jgi:hypothetical protein
MSLARITGNVEMRKHVRKRIFNVSISTPGYTFRWKVVAEPARIPSGGDQCCTLVEPDHRHGRTTRMYRGKEYHIFMREKTNEKKVGKRV